MCLTVPAKVIGRRSGRLKLEDGRLVKPAADSLGAGDWVLVTADLAVAKISAEEAREINNYFKK